MLVDTRIEHNTLLILQCIRNGADHDVDCCFEELRAWHLEHPGSYRRDPRSSCLGEFQAWGLPLLTISVHQSKSPLPQKGTIWQISPVSRCRGPCDWMNAREIKPAARRVFLFRPAGQQSVARGASVTILSRGTCASTPNSARSHSAKVLRGWRCRMLRENTRLCPT